MARDAPLRSWLAWAGVPAAMLLWAAWWFTMERGWVPAWGPAVLLLPAATFAAAAALLRHGWTVPATAAVLVVAVELLHAPPACASDPSVYENCFDEVRIGLFMVGYPAILGGIVGAVAGYAARTLRGRGGRVATAR